MSAASSAYTSALANHFDAKKYGLTKTNASGANHDKGIIEGPQGGYYQIDGFKRNQKEGLDKDAGGVFKSSLYDDAVSQSGGEYSASTFNTATDVENALKHLKGEAPTEEKDRTYELSERSAKAKAYTAAYEDEFLPNSGDYMIKNDQDVKSDFMNAYKLNLAKELKPKTPDGSTRQSKVQDEKDKVAGIEK